MDDVLKTIAAHWDGRAGSFDDEPDHGLTDPVTLAAVTPLVVSVEVHDLAADDDLWGHHVQDERYPVVATVS